MDLPCPEWVRHVEQKWTELSSEGRERFNLLTDIDEIFHSGLSLIHPEDLTILSRISKKYSVKKCPDLASECRQQGNLSFKVKDYTAAALYYSKGVCNADKNTEELSLCYANRSAALFYHGLYKECLEDIRRALEAGYPSHLQDKLTTRQTACLYQLEKLKKSNTMAKNLQTQLSQKRRDSSTCTAHAVSVYFNPEKGRHLLATENKFAGEVVLEDKAYGCVLIPVNRLKTEAKKAGKTAFDTEARHCHHCLSQTLSFVPCPSCSYSRYCGEMCQKEAWEHWHQWECHVGADLLAIGVLGHLALRVALKAGQNEVQRARESSSGMSDADHVDGKSGPSKGVSPVHLTLGGHCTKNSDHTDYYNDDSYMGIYSLLPHVAEHSPSARFILAVTMAALYRRLQCGPPPDKWASCKGEGASGNWQCEMSMLGATALRHMMQLRCNAQAVTAIRVKEERDAAVQSSREICIATAIFPVLSLLNHSCCPNTSISFNTGFKTDALCQFTGSEGQYDHPLICQCGVTVTIRTSKDVTAGQEILHCYGPHCSRMEVKERQRLLLEQYFFHCKCEACQRELKEGSQNTEVNAAPGLKCVKCENPLQSHMNWYVCSQPSCGYQITIAELQKSLQGLQCLLDQAFHLMERDRPDEAIRILKSASSKADSILAETHPLQGELADAKARAYATTGKWNQAASHLKRSIVAIQAQFGEDSVELGQHLFKLAQLHFNGGDCGSALSVIPRACKLISLHCGPHCDELQELQEMERCLKGLL
ncbi:SET and MYND domain-containing protein 4 isoform X2 [Xyrauchen texanus]|uniref:SET and MYND domain-containing protein 4 isoform X2 n=1 Tax=Xyrauchen texanus TaxID=154827 RepID=UPI002241C06E|nr:SET and MYND domain-containing protein 4 isoform X2 [Xyrauchen texanus]